MAASPVCLLLLPPPKNPLPSITIVTPAAAFGSGRTLSVSSYHLCRRHRHISDRFMMGRAPNCSNKVVEADIESPILDCVGTGADVECVVKEDSNSDVGDVSLSLLDWVLLISPFFFWGTAMVAMKQVLPKTGPFFVAAVRLIPAGAILVSFTLFKGRPLPSGLIAWLSIALFGLVDATCFQGFLAQGLLRTSAGLGSVIIDSQPLTVAILAALLFGESLGLIGVAGLVLGVIGLLLLEVPTISLDNDFSLVGSGELWMLLAAQSMAVGTVMVRWVSKYSDPVMATGWHMIIGGLPIVIISVLNHEPALQGSLIELSTNDVIALVYTSIFGSAISYGLYFYNATRGSLTKLSSLTFLTPMFASLFGFLYLGETFTPLQCVGALVTIAAIYMVPSEDEVHQAILDMKSFVEFMAAMRTLDFVKAGVTWCSAAYLIVTDQMGWKGLRVMNAAVAVGELIRYRTKNIAIFVNHLLFADDILIFMNGSRNSLCKLLNIMDDFCLLSGQQLNSDKSIILFPSKELACRAMKELEADPELGSEVLTCMPELERDIVASYHYNNLIDKLTWGGAKDKVFTTKRF
ncbi:unnamed protein product [Rhodiola kirilowii]